MRMKVKNYRVRTKGDNLYKGRDKSYEYSLKWLFGVNVEDLVELLGAEPACKLLSFYGGTCMYIPKPSTMKRRIQEAMIREEYLQLIEDGVKLFAAQKHLAKKYKCHLMSIRKKIGKQYPFFTDSVDKKRLFAMRNVADKKAVELISQYRGLFKRYKLI